MGVDHGGLDVLVAEEFLHGADVVAFLQQLGGKGVAEGMGRYGFFDAGLFGGVVDGALQGRRVDVVAADNAGQRVGGALAGGEDELPGPFPRGAAVFFAEGIGEDDLTVAFGQVFLVQGFSILQQLFQFGDEAVGQDGGAVVVALAAADDDLAVVKIQVFNAQTQALAEADAGTIEDAGHEARGAAHLVDDLEGFGVAEDGGQAFGADRVGEVGREGDLDLEDLAVEEEDGAECLVGGGG